MRAAESFFGIIQLHYLNVGRLFQSRFETRDAEQRERIAAREISRLEPGDQHEPHCTVLKNDSRQQ